MKKSHSDPHVSDRCNKRVLPPTIRIRRQTQPHGRCPERAVDECWEDLNDAIASEPRK